METSQENDSSTEIIYDLCIIGAGMFGSAAARHASANPGLKICLIGPDEPSSLEERKHREIFASHYDEARLVSTLDPNIEVGILARNSMKSFRELEKLSGISFYSPLGLLNIGRKYSEWMERIVQAAENSKLEPAIDLSSNGIFEKRFPFMKIGGNDSVLFDDTGAGYVNPRKLVAAEKKVAIMQGCHLILDVAKEVRSSAEGCHEIITENRRKVYAKRILFTTGAFTNLKKFYPLPKLNITPLKETVALLRISTEEAQKLSYMPSVVYNSEDYDFEAYILPPVLYPDGRHYLKIGSLRTNIERQGLSDLKSIKEWFLSNGDQNIIESGSKFLMKILPTVKIERIVGASCVSAATPSYLPYIDRISPTITVAVAGNGKGAKICEEVGRIAAELSLTGIWNSKVPKRLFNAIPL